MINNHLFHNNEVYLWVAHLEAPHCWNRAKSKINILNNEEKAILFNYPSLKLRKLYLLTRVMLRDILSIYLNIPARDINFSKGPYGKPFISNNIKIPLYFNLSHCNQCVAVGVSNLSPIGIDIEHIHRKIDIDRIVSHFFSDLEGQYFLNQTKKEKLNSFFKMWTLKEAYIKNLGCGLNENILKKTRFYLRENKNHCLSFIDKTYTNNFSFITKTILNDYQLSAVVNYKPYKFRFVNW